MNFFNIIANITIKIEIRSTCQTLRGDINKREVIQKYIYIWAYLCITFAVLNIFGLFMSALNITHLHWPILDILKLLTYLNNIVPLHFHSYIYKRFQSDAFITLVSS